MKKLLWFFIVTGLITSCKPKQRLNGFLSPSNVPSQFFNIDPDNDTILRTSHNAYFAIRKGTFKSGEPVTIEIKEVYSANEIFLSGLTTNSDGKPLRSAGMLLFNAQSGGRSIEPSLAVKAFVPTKEADPQMQLFRGDIKEDGSINWVDPNVLVDTTKPNTALQHSIDAGRLLFQSHCAPCHSINREGTGPALKNVQYRGPWKNPRNLLAWINHPSRFMANNQYTQDLKAKYGTMMVAFPTIDLADVNDLLSYINSRSSGNTKPVAPTADTTNKDCGYDTIYVTARNEFAEYDTTTYPEVMPGIDNNRNLDTSIVVPDSSYYSDYDIDLSIDPYKDRYEFEISANGWYNIDAFMKEDKLIELVELVADLKMTEKVSMNVYLFIPTERVMQSTFTKKGNQYYFDVENGKIPLPLGHRAIILAFGSKKDKVVYGVSEFTINKKQLIPVDIKETTKEGLKYILHSKNINGVEIDAIEKKMEIHKKPCDQNPSPSSVSNEVSNK